MSNLRPTRSSAQPPAPVGGAEGIIEPPVEVIRDEGTLAFVCTHCARSFATKGGCSTHNRRAHPEQYHLIQAVAAATRPKQRWSNEEMLMMANQEAEMLLAGTSPVLINQQLCRVVSGRTLDGIKGKRRTKAYRDSVQSRLAVMRVAAIPGPVQTPPTQVGRARRGDPISPEVPDGGELAVNPDWMALVLEYLGSLEVGTDPSNQ